MTNEVYTVGYSGTGALPRPITARGGLTYEPGLHLNLVAELSEGWGPPLTEGGGRQFTRWPGPCGISHW